MQTLLDQGVAGLSLIMTLVPETGVLRQETFDNEADFIARLRSLLDSDEEVAVSLSLGFKLGVSRPPLRFLVTPWGNQPLFNPLPAELSLEEDGFLGKRYDELAIQHEEPDEDEVDTLGELDGTEEEEEATVDDAVDIFTQRGDDEEEDEG